MARDALGRHEVDAEHAIAASPLHIVPRAVLAELLAAGRTIAVPAGGTVHAAGDADRHFELVVCGFLRVYVAGRDGRQMTIRYCRAGDILGAATLYATPFAMPVTIQALVDSTIVSLPADRVRRLVEREPLLARAILTEMGNRVMSFIGEIESSSFESVRRRVARHLLDLASEHQRLGALRAPVTQQQLADAVGSVREVVVRELRRLRAAGAIRTSRAGIVILDPQKLHDWNEGS